MDIRNVVDGMIREILKLPIETLIGNNLDEIGFNSLTFIRLVVSIEDYFNIEFDDDKLSLEIFNTIDDLVQFIRSKM